MKIKSIYIHNFRSIENEKINLQDYTVLIGSNNSGKSNIIAALLYFYDELSLKDTDYFCCPDRSADELFVEVEFSNLSPELMEKLPEKYRLPHNRMKIRRTARKGSKPVYNGYVMEDDREKLLETNFFGAGEVGKGKIGNVIYIPALKNVVDELKTTGSATMAKLLKEVVEPALVESEEYEKFSEAVSGLSEKLKGEPVQNFENWDGKSISGIEYFLNNELSNWDCSVKIDLEPLEPARLAQQAVNVSLIEEGQIALPIDSKGLGLQRSVHIAFVKLWAEITRRKERERNQRNRRIFHPEFTLLLIEEPETFQHPQQQYQLYDDLRELAKYENQQVVASTHSPYFLTPHIEDISSIIRVIKRANVTSAKGLTQRTLDELTREENDRFRYHLWLNQERNEMFFAKNVILVEGPTEKVLFNWLLDNGSGISPSHRQKCFVMDCGGKFVMHKFMKLLGEFEIPHLVIHDKDDENKPIHLATNTQIRNSRNRFTLDIKVLDPDIENFLNFAPPRRASEKPPAILDYLADPNQRNDNALGQLSRFIIQHIAV